MYRKIAILIIVILFYMIVAIAALQWYAELPSPPLPMPRENHASN